MCNKGNKIHDSTYCKTYELLEGITSLLTKSIGNHSQIKNLLFKDNSEIIMKNKSIMLHLFETLVFLQDIDENTTMNHFIQSFHSDSKVEPLDREVELFQEAQEDYSEDDIFGDIGFLTTN